MYVQSKQTTVAHTEKLLSVAMENHTNGLQPERPTSSSGRPEERGPSIAAEAKWPYKRSYV